MAARRCPPAVINDPVLAVAVRAARRAGSVIVDAARDLKRLPAHAKEHADIVTAADNEAENAIVATHPRGIPRARDPGRGVGRHRQAHAMVRRFKWIVDPHRRQRELRPRLPVLRACRSRLRTARRSRTPSCSTRFATSSSPRSAARARSSMARRFAYRAARRSSRRCSARCFRRAKAPSAARLTCHVLDTMLGRSAAACGARASARSTSRTSPRAGSTASGSRALKPWDVAPGALLIKRSRRSRRRFRRRHGVSARERSDRRSAGRVQSRCARRSAAGRRR